MNNNVIVNPPTSSKVDVNLLASNYRKREKADIDAIERTWNQINRDNVKRDGEKAVVKCWACTSFLLRHNQEISTEWDDGFVCDFLKKDDVIVTYLEKNKKRKKISNVFYTFVCRQRGCKQTFDIEIEEE